MQYEQADIYTDCLLLERLQFSMPTQLLWFVLSTVAFESLEARSFEEVTEEFFTDLNYTSGEVVRWLRPIPHLSFAIRSAYRFPGDQYLVVARIDREFLKSLRLLPIDGAGFQASTYWIEIDDLIELNNHIYGKLRLIKKFSKKR